MINSTSKRVAGFVGTLGVAAALFGAGASGTGAYFSDAKQGTVTGTMGSIRITAFAGGGPDATGISFDKLLPGEAQEKTVRFQNTGQNSQDVWLVFNKADLGDGNASTHRQKINDLGTDAEIHLSNGAGEVFGSANLNDDPGCSSTGPACMPLPETLQVADNLAPNKRGSFTFGFMPSADFSQSRYEDLPFLSLRYKLVATQHGVPPQ